MMAATRSRRERELVAVAFNQKEQRVLEKSIATLKLEASYSLKLLDLHNRTVKVNFRQLKDRVSRIKSHLSPDEIQKLRKLESEGKLHPMYPPVSLGSALKIAAAARRLNSSHGKRPPAPPSRARSALPRVNLPDKEHSLTPPPGALKRSNSVSGAFIDAPPPRGGARPGSANIAVGRTTPTPDVTVSGVRKVKTGAASGPEKAADSKPGSRLQVNGSSVSRPGSSALRVPTPNHLHQHNGGSTSSSSMDSNISKRSSLLPPSTSDLHHHPKRPGTHLNGHSQHHGHSNGFAHHQGYTDTSNRSARNSAHSRSGTTSHGSHAPFSSHVATEKEAREREENEDKAAAGGPHGSVTHTPRSQQASMERTLSFAGLNDDTVDDLGEDLYAERRAELLEEEQYRASVINKRKDRFLHDIDVYLKENPPLKSLPITPKASPPEGGADKGSEEADPVAALGGAVFRRRRVEFDNHPTYLPEMDYKDRLMGLWRDMNKCRYLRVPDEMIDLSGINTLATDTMKLFQVLKHREGAPVTHAWTE